MKRLNLVYAVLFGVFFLSCSCSSNDGNDNATTTNNTGQLKQSEQKVYFNGILEEKIIFEFENQKPNLVTFYDASNHITFKNTFNYENGLLKSIKGYLPNGILSNDFKIFYDNSNRIIKTISSEDSGNSVTTINFIYNNNNTITSNSDSNGNLSSKTFIINSNGVIDKEFVDNNLIVSVQYQGYLPLSKTYASTTYNYTYHENGIKPNAFRNLFGASLTNAVLFQNSLDDSYDALSTKLETRVTSNSSLIEYTYTLNQQNFPLTEKEFSNGILVNETNYTYF